MTLALVRHGRTRWNQERRMQGRTDMPLDRHGRAQADAAGRLLARGVWTQIISSPLRRAEESARIIGTHLGDIAMVCREDLKERDYGVAEGVPVAEAAERRAVAALRELAAAPGDAVIVAHGTVLRLGVQALIGGPIPRILNGEVLLLDPTEDEDGFRVRRLTA